MLRVFCLFLIVLAGLLLEPASLAAQEQVEAPAENAVWPAHPAPMTRGPGGYLSWLKLLLCWLIFLAWVGSCDWVNRDTFQHRFNQSLWNPVMVFPFLATFFLITISVPVFIAGYTLLVVSYTAPLGVYIWHRNQKVELHQRVLTPDHFRHLMAGRAKKAGMQIDAEKKKAHQHGAEVEITPLGGKDKTENQANLILARQSPGFVTAKDMVADAVDRRAVKVLLDYTSEGVATQYSIDGVWHQVDPFDREGGDMLLAVLKKLCNLDMEERRTRQEGRFAATYHSQKFVCHLVSQGTKAGERAIVQLAGLSVKIASMAELGMRDKVAEKLNELLSSQQGIVLFSAMPGGGLTTTMAVALRSTDRFMRDIIDVIDAEADEPEIENIEIHLYQAMKGETPDSLLPTLLRKEPDVVVVRDLPNAATVNILCEASKSCLVISTVRAKEAVEALLRVLMVKAPAASFAAAVSGVICQRLIRRLCEDCKQAYAPPPELLKKLGIPSDRVQTLYRPPQPDPQEKQEVCQRCGGIGYYGQTAIFEQLQINDRLRQTLTKQPKLEVLRKVARGAGHRTLQEEGIILVARGVTSLAELQRVLKQ